MKHLQNWKTLNGLPVKESIDQEIRRVLIKEAELGHEVKVCIGTDSQVKGKYIQFATAIVFVRKGNGAFMFIQSETIYRKMTINERMMLEVSKSIGVAYSLNSVFVAYNIAIELHADINTHPNFKSNDALKEATGYSAGMGYELKAKPHAFASSSCANRAVQ